MHSYPYVVARLFRPCLVCVTFASRIVAVSFQSPDLGFRLQTPRRVVYTPCIAEWCHSRREVVRTVYKQSSSLPSPSPVQEKKWLRNGLRLRLRLRLTYKQETMRLYGVAEPQG